VRGQERRECRLRWARRGNSYWVALDGPDGYLEAADRDLFEALASVRRRLEVSGWLIAVQGARRDTFPSGMVRDMGGARRVYVLEPGRPVAREHLVDIFADADPADLGTVEEQERNYRDWLASTRER